MPLKSVLPGEAGFVVHVMLKALEIYGFKSFADRTRFEFRPGITAIVGPNGSGKSNVVDAIKWVLGEQSIKNLRGKEMTDVIFNGSATRRPMNFAEITITLDNSRGILPLDSPEVHITRRLYRSGESEYLINRQTCRLRDIRDLLAGTGLATQAYSVIEQGKIDQLLQATPLERRVVFEEAAGISRFKSRKLEAQRRLERLEQNLLRLNDIVEEVEGRLRVVRSQAGKAQRYQRYADRLKELRTHLARMDWHRLNRELARLEEEGSQLNRDQETLVEEAEQLERRLKEIESQDSHLAQQLTDLQSQLAADRETIAALEADLEHGRARDRELEKELGRLRKVLAELNLRAGELCSHRQSTAEALRAAEEQYRDLMRQVAEGERSLTNDLEALDRRRTEYEERRAEHWEVLQKVLAADNRLQQLQREHENLQASYERNSRESEEIKRIVGETEQRLDELKNHSADLLQRLQTTLQDLHRLSEERDRCRQELQQIREEWSALHQRRTAAAERARLLREWEEQLEGLSLGVKDFLHRVQTSESHLGDSVCGLVADLLQTELQVALLVDVALGDAAEWIVLRNSMPWLDQLRRGSAALNGRVCLLCLDQFRKKADGQSMPTDISSLGQEPGVLGLAEDFVQVEEEFLPVRHFLLGKTWFVESLDTALALASRYADLRFVTLAGELITSEGLIVAGQQSSGLGLVSRRSELRNLTRSIAQWDQQLQQYQEAIATSEHQLKTVEQRIANLEEQRRSLSQELKDCEQRQQELQRMLQEYLGRCGALEGEIAAAAEGVERIVQQQQQALLEKTQWEEKAAELSIAITQLGEEIAQLEANVQDRHGVLTALKIELAKSEERLAALQNQLRRQEEAEAERLKEVTEIKNRLAETEKRLMASQRELLSLEARLAELYGRKDELSRVWQETAEARRSLQKERQKHQQQLQDVRRRLRQIEERQHKLELDLNSVRHEKSTLIQRVEEDYGISLNDLDHPCSPEESQDRTEIQREIDDLKRKIHNLGNVNLEALEELQQLEERYNGLSSQCRDLTSAKNSLERIIERINADSRRLFAATLQTVSEHFGTLFRELFGGGQASIELEPGRDILESGIEIVARPPGKEPRNISLLSGGEKSLTCVALLLAIFRSRPSPFCVLDEVDAALDEANIDRFTKVLRDFLSITQFVIVTHSKRTAICADTLYGVTMQESGVSKRVSVRLEDLSDQGEILSAGSVQSFSTSPEEKAA
ncbi:MAG TPA: chromosome segregation protein SMC [Thermogutta sp.]|nr:chromosome segregation protein SMC [Thermogutta sp.]HPU07080.1 chromosome segregation protein SMC [Thermogutta sp.]